VKVRGEGWVGFWSYPQDSLFSFCRSFSPSRLSKWSDTLVLKPKMVCPAETRAKPFNVSSKLYIFALDSNRFLLTSNNLVLSMSNFCSCHRSWKGFPANFSHICVPTFILIFEAYVDLSINSVQKSFKSVKLFCYGFIRTFIKSVLLQLSLLRVWEETTST
jgi:hypothetical protein